MLLNASRRVQKGRPKNYIPETDIHPLAAMFLKGEPVPGEIAVITREQAEEADYDLSPSRWVQQNGEVNLGSISALLAELDSLHKRDEQLTKTVLGMLAPLAEESANV